MEKYKEIIPIFFAVDDKYIPFLSEVILNKMGFFKYIILLYLGLIISDKDTLIKCITISSLFRIIYPHRTFILLLITKYVNSFCYFWN